ncbi:large exoprotein [Microbacterium sp. ABRD28]|uniref:large exoprotein n=1 Tax=Microbacterium sp. ABRD28 TaxID=2268461 RepID=UPI0013DD98E3|nr:large exoprotein [Microbacterium sp. ABRD28]
MDSTYDGYGAMLAFLLILLPLLLIFALAGYLISAFFLMKIFEKAGVEGKWRAWVPVYNTLVLAKLGDLSPWVMLGAVVGSAILSQIPVIGWILSLVAIAVGVIVGWRVGLKLGKDWPYLLLWLIPGVGTLIWLGILAFSSDRWNPNIPPAPWANSFLKDTTVWPGIPQQQSAVAAPGYGYPTAASGGPAAPPAGYEPAPGYQAPPAPAAAPPATPPAPPATPPAAAPPANPTPPPAAPPANEPPAGPDAPRP